MSTETKSSKARLKKEDECSLVRSHRYPLWGEVSKETVHKPVLTEPSNKGLPKKNGVDARKKNGGIKEASRKRHPGKITKPKKNLRKIKIG